MKLTAPAGGCTVRMYRQGLGDCFLLAFGAENRQQKYVLIDCGVLLGTEDAEMRMQQVVSDIRQACDGHLDAIVITHEHWDHVSGFIQAREEFEKLEVDQVWYAWTEDPANPLAKELRNRRKAALEGLRRALDRMGASDSPYASRIRGVGEFFGPDLGATGSSTTEKALDWVKAKWTKCLYCEPGGEPRAISGLPRVRFLVLGPPADAKLIRRSSPSSSAGEVYLGDMAEGGLGLYLKALGAVQQSAAAPPDKVDPGAPFNLAYRCDPGQTTVADVNERYRSEAWRSIDSDWLGAAGGLALQLDAHTNNTSLVLAVELLPVGKVLLFPGDAQVGNWLSWDNVRWTGDMEKVTAADLLSRTVPYKVGHHGSHNATLRHQGLERMSSPNLAALIPVSRDMAAKKSWRMPHKPLLERLTERAMGRVVLSDSGLPKGNGDASVRDFLKACSVTDLYVDVTVSA